MHNEHKEQKASKISILETKKHTRGHFTTQGTSKTGGP